MQQRRDYSIDLLKFIFAFIIVLYHSKGFIFKEQNFLFIGAIPAVEFFFIVAGFYLAKGAVKKETYYQGTLGKDTLHFMWGKICRLMPNVVVAWCIAFVVRHLWRTAASGSVLYDLFQGIRDVLFLEEAGLTIRKFVPNNVTWYLSAMLLAMFLLYPLVRKLKDTFFYIIAPLLVIVLYGVLFQNFGNLTAPRWWSFGFIMKGTLRAIAALALGCVIFKITEGLKKFQFTKLVRIICTIVAIATVCVVVWHMYGHPSSIEDFDLVLLLAIALILILSNLSYLPDLKLPKAVGNVISWLGAFSFSLYLGHGFWGINLKYLKGFKRLELSTRILIYLAISIATALFIMYFSKFLKALWNRRKGLIVKN